MKRPIGFINGNTTIPEARRTGRPFPPGRSRWILIISEEAVGRPRRDVVGWRTRGNIYGNYYGLMFLNISVVVVFVVVFFTLTDRASTILVSPPKKVTEKSESFCAGPV